MPVRLRLQRKGSKRKPFYHIVAADSRAKRDGKFIERIGWYNPNTKPGTMEISHERALTWLKNGAEPTTTVRSLLSKAGVLYLKHLHRGLAKGALTQEQVESQFKAWLDCKAKNTNHTVALASWVADKPKPSFKPRVTVTPVATIESPPATTPQQPETAAEAETTADAETVAEEVQPQTEVQAEIDAPNNNNDTPSSEDENA